MAASGYGGSSNGLNSNAYGKSEVQLGEWSTGINDCFDDMGICCCGTWCPCVQAGRNVEIITKGAVDMQQACCLTYLGGCFYLLPHRLRLRETYNLPEKPMNDCCTYTWCAHCAICQEARELKNRGLDPALGYAAAAMQAPPEVGMQKNSSRGS